MVAVLDLGQDRDGPLGGELGRRDVLTLGAFVPVIADVGEILVGVGVLFLAMPVSSSRG